MKFVVDCDSEEFRRYYRRNGYEDGDLEHLIETVIKDSSQLIVWRKSDKIIGHTVWHESNIREHRRVCLLLFTKKLTLLAVTVHRRIRISSKMK